MNELNGLSKEEVKLRIKNGLVNYDTTTPSKSIKQILIENTFTLFNFINLILGILIILVGSYKNLLFLGVVICNILISTIQEIRAKKTVDKLSVISSSLVKVIRDGKPDKISINEVVKDDLVIFELGDQIVTDSKVISGTCEVNESFITGESDTISKCKDDMLLSGSFVVSGKVICKVMHVGLDNYTSIISKDAKIMNKEINSQIMRTLKKIVKYISICLIPVGILLLLRQFNIPNNTSENAIVTVVAALVGMIPEGLMLLVSTVLAVSVVKLSKFNVLVQDLYSIETLARVDTLCLDKTGTITKGEMYIDDIIPLNNHMMNEIDEMLSDISTNLNDNNPTFKAINEKYGKDSKNKADSVVPFSSERKYSKVIFEKYSYIIGAPEFILEDEDKKIIKQASELSLENRVLVLIKEEKKKKEPYALLLIKDVLRENVEDTLNYFKDNEVELKIISGDSPKTVSNIAKSVGINVKGIFDFSTLDNYDNLNEIVENNNIFGRVKPNEKRMIISALKNNNHVVAMTGDGVNDVLALKESDCGIAMNDGSDAARNVAEMVLLDSDFNSIPHIVKEGRKTINNIERSATLFLSKTVYATLLAIIFMFIKYLYPFIPIQMTFINMLTIGIPAFILALEHNYDRVKDKFLLNVLSRSIPSGITTVINIILLVIIGNYFNLPKEQISTIAVAITGYTALLLIYKISAPLNTLRKMLFVFITALFILVFVSSPLRDLFSLTLLSPNSILLLVMLIYIATKVFKILYNFLNILFRKYIKD